MEEEESNAYRWESGYEKTWEAVVEDSSGKIEASVADLVLKSKRRRLQERQEAGIRLGIMRHVFIILDMSDAMNGQDLKPSRFHCVLKILEDFIPEFYEQNPIGQMGLIVTYSKLAKKYTELTSNSGKHLENLTKLQTLPCRGEQSLQNALEVAMSSMCHLPPHSSKEILVLYGALNTCDPGEISQVVQKVSASKIRVSAVGLAAELYVVKDLTQKTGGTFSVCLNDSHLKELIREQLEPPPADTKAVHTLIRVGFPHKSQVNAKAAVCVCHRDESPAPSTKGYYCSMCSSKYCELPAECKVCSLMLVTAPHLARSYRHLFPLKSFTEIVPGVEHAHCFGCSVRFKTETEHKNIYECSDCRQVFCCDCDIFLHDTVHSCPGCSSLP